MIIHNRFQASGKRQNNGIGDENIKRAKDLMIAIFVSCRHQESFLRFCRRCLWNVSCKIKKEIIFMAVYYQRLL